MYTSQKDPPFILQLDCETDAGSKLQQLAKYGFHFTSDDGVCDHEAVQRMRDKMERGQIEVRLLFSVFRVQVRRNFSSWGKLQFRVYWWMVDYILWTPWVGPLLKPYLPLVGFILMFTM